MYNALWSISLLFIFLGILLAGAGVLLKLLAQKNEVYKGRAEARVVDIVTEPRKGEASLSEFRNYQVAVFEFYAGGHLVKVRDSADTYPCPYYRGQKVRIAYDESAPEHFQIEDRNIFCQLGSAANMLSAGFILAGFLLFFLYASGVRI